MKSMRIYVSSVAVAFLVFALIAAAATAADKKPVKNAVTKLSRSESEWKKILSAEQFYVLRQQGTERAFTGKYHNHHAEGRYLCAACNLPLFSSKTKFDSGTGWPSFFAALEKAHVEELVDLSHGMCRIEVRCARCGGHLGHVFDDGPKPTGLRYCINSVSLRFEGESGSQR